MSFGIKIVTGINLILLLNISLAFSQSDRENLIPHLEKRGEATQLIVNGKPFLILGGELHNSSASSLQYLKPLLPKAAKMHLNTVLAPVYWDQTEPVKGKFDFSLVDALIKEARENNLRLIILWFGSWKNGLSTYVPQWVKKDLTDFPRVKMSNGKSTETLSVFSQKNLNADARAFATLMMHIKAIDSHYRTVIMVQVENEVGIQGDTRDRSEEADTYFAKPVPQALIEGLEKYKSELQPEFKQIWAKTGFKTTGNWEDVFGKGPVTDEIFMAWYYSNYVNEVAAAGKKEYPLPMYVNAWISPVYPRGGPVAYMHDIWRIGAPDIDIFSPDIYQPDFKGIIPKFKHNWNPLFIPECFAGSVGAANAFYAIGKYNAIGYSPFGYEDRVKINGPISQAYKLLQGFMPVIMDAQDKGAITSVMLTADDAEDTINIGGYKIELCPTGEHHGNNAGKLAYGIIINSGPNKFIIAGYNLEATFIPSTPGPSLAGFISVQEGIFINGHWQGGRELNGDAIMKSYSMTELTDKNLTGEVARLEDDHPEIIKVRLYRFE